MRVAITQQTVCQAKSKGVRKMSKREVVTHGVTPEHFESDEEKKLKKIKVYA